MVSVVTWKVNRVTIYFSNSKKKDRKCFLSYNIAACSIMTRTLKWSYVDYFRHWFIILLLRLEQFLAPQLRIFLWKQGKLHSTVKTVYIVSSNHTCLPMRAHVVSQLFNKFKLKRSTRKVLFKQLGDVCLISQMYANNDNTNDSIKLLTWDIASGLI